MSNGYDIVGYNPWYGYGGDSPEVGFDIVGQKAAAVPQLAALARPMFPAMLGGATGGMPGGYPPPQSLPPRPTVVQSSGPSEMRRQVLPVGTTTLAAGATATIQNIPQRPFRCERLVVSHPGGPGDISVTDVRVGATPQFVAGGPVDSSVFQATAVGSSLRGDTAQPGITVSVTVTNNSAGPIAVNAAIIGEALE